MSKNFLIHNKNLIFFVLIDKIEISRNTNIRKIQKNKKTKKQKNKKTKKQKKHQQLLTSQTKCNSTLGSDPDHAFKTFSDMIFDLASLLTCSVDSYQRPAIRKSILRLQSFFSLSSLNTESERDCN